MNILLGAPCACRGKRHSATTVVNRYRVTRLRPGDDVADAKINRRELIRDFVRMRRHLMVDGMRTISTFLIQFFHDRLNEVCDTAETAYYARRKAVYLELGDSEHEILWRDAIEEVLGRDANVQLVVNYQPIVQSIAARAYSRTGILLGQAEAPDASVNILRRSQGLAQQVTRINETTRVRLADTIARAMQDGQTVPEIVKTIRASVPEIIDSRVPTIARTEVGRAIDEGTKQSMKESKSITHISVVGCKAREPGSPTWRGESTCNIDGVPIEFVDELTWHPNHTGCIVPSRFVTDR